MQTAFRFYFSMAALLSAALLAGGPAAFGQSVSIPIELTPSMLAPGSKIAVRLPQMAMPVVACTGAGNQSVGGFMQCADESDATLNSDRNAWWNCCAPAGWLPSEAYQYNFPAIQATYPCVAGLPVNELILTITINSVTFNPGSPYICCQQYFEGLYANLYDNCPTGMDCPVAGDGLRNTTNPGTGDCAANGEHLNYNPATSSFPLGIPFTSTTTCLNTIISTSNLLGVDIVPSFFYQAASAAGCNCPTDLISQGLVTVDYDLEVEYVFCSNNLPANCFPSTFAAIGPLCETSPVIMLPTTSTNGITGTWNPATLNPAGQGGNTLTSVFTPTPGQCVGGTSEMDVVVTAATVPAFAPIGPLCETASPVSLPATSTNGVMGTWNVGATFNPAGQGGSTVPITFTPNTGQCASVQTMNIVVNEPVTPTFALIGPLCETAPPVPLPATSTNGVMGTWNVGTTFNPAGQGGSTATITFTPNAGQCATVQTMNIMVNEPVTPTFALIGPLCETASPVPLPATSTNGVMGTWNVGSTFNPAGQGGSTVTVTFTPNAGQCATGQTMNITVNEPLTPAFAPIGPLCENDPPVPLPATSTNGVSGTWNVGTTFNPAGQGGSNVTIIFTPNTGQCATGQIMNIVVETLITPFFNPIGPLCESSLPVPLPGTSLNGIMGTWDVGTSFNPAGQGGNIVNLFFTPNAGECAGTTTMNIVVNEPLTPTFAPIGPLCESASPVALPATSTNGVSGTWNVGTSFNPAGQGGSTATITFIPNSGQCAATTTMNIVVNEPATPTFAPIGPLCESSPPVALPATSTNGVSGTWNVGTNFNPAGQGGSTATIIFTPNAGQCAIVQTMNIVVNEPLTPTFAPIGPLCESNPPVALPGTSTNGVTGTWNVGTSFNPAGQGGTTANLVFTPTAGQCAASQMLAVTVNALPTHTISEVACNANLDDYFIDFQSNANTVSSSAGTVTNLGGGQFTIDGVPEGTNITVTLVITSTGCSTTFMVASPTCNCLPVSPPVGTDVEICNGDPIPALSVTVGAGLEVDWYNAATGGTLLLGNSTSFTPSGAGTFYAEALDPASNCVSSFREAIELNILPLDTTFVQGTTCNPSAVGTTSAVFATATCDSVVIVTLTLLPAVEFFQNLSSCDPADVGLDTLVLVSAAGCDSLVISETTLSPADTVFAAATTCNAALVGVDTMVFATATCDSVVITTTTLLPPNFSFLTAISCNPADVGLDTLVLSNLMGCDSLVITVTTLLPLPPSFAQASTCDPAQAGVSTVVLQTAQGCDSTVIVTTVLLPADVVFQNAFSCDPAQIGLDTLVLSNQNGCDSLVVTTTALSAADTSFVNAATCDATQVGVETVVFATATCDSVVITTTTLLPPDLVFLATTSCNPSDVGLDTLVLNNQAGCDSLVITVTTLLPLPPSFAQASTCDPAMAGVSTAVLQTAMGCDSIVIVTTVLLPADVVFQNAFSCDPAEVGTDTLVLSNQNGCDSLLVTVTALSAADTTFVNATTCDPNLDGVVTTVFPTPLCDSVVITTTALLTSYVIFVNTTSCDPANVGTDTLYLTTQNGCDSLIVTNTNLLPGSEVLLSATTCIPAEVGTDTLVLLNQAGCDSLVITETVLLGGIADAEISSLDPDCAGQLGSISIGEVQGGTAPYQFSIDGGASFSGSPMFEQLPPGEYPVVVTDADGCVFEAVVQLTAVLAPQVSLDPAEVELTLGESYLLQPTLSVPDSSLASVTWSPSDFLTCSDCLSPTATPLETTAYSVTIMDENGCVASASITLLLDKNIRVYLPNAFSPNGDGINDHFVVQGDEKVIAQVDEFRIFDRWGGHVFENFNFQVNDFSAGWDGRWKGKDLHHGVYVYLAFVRLVNGERLMVEGEVVLMR